MGSTLAVLFGGGHFLWRWIQFEDLGSAGLVVGGFGLIPLLRVIGELPGT